MNVSVSFRPVGRKIEFARGETAWAAAAKAGVPLASICGGQSVCGKCLLRIIRGKVNPVTEVEREFLSEEELQAGYRLACEVLLLGSVVFETPIIRDDHSSKLAIPELEKAFTVSPGIHKVEVKMPPPSLADPRSDAARLTDTLTRLNYRSPRPDLGLLRILPGALRAGGYHVTCVFDSECFIALETGNTAEAFYGLAVDFGTTTVAAYLVHLGAGERAYAAAISNRQAIYGDDVISRLSYAQSGGLTQLRLTAVEVLNDLISLICESAGVQPTSIYAMTITGNTTMLHFLGGLPIDHLGVAPYVATSTELSYIAARELGLQINPSATVWFLPGIGAFVGADCVCGALATGMADGDEIQLLIDFGTNAEIVLGSRNRLYACATAAGPAFEGARIQHGMRAAPGAIDRVWIEDGQVHVRTIGDLPPLGIAGTGLVSAIAALRAAGIVDKKGILHYSSILAPEWWMNDSRDRKLVLAPAALHQPPITLSQSDVCEFQLAKAAVRAGIKILQRKMDIDDTRIQRILLAGAFGSFMDAGDALAADLLPEVPIDRVESVGNAAGFGAITALLSQSQRQKLCELAQFIHYVELSVEPDFNRLFAKSLAFT